MTLTEFHKTIRERFSAAARRYEGLCSIQAELAQELIGRAQVRAGDSILDVGCGTGALALEAIRRSQGGNVVGVDAAAGMVRVAREHYGRMTWVQADAKHLPFREWTFDLVVSSSAYHWVGDLGVAFHEAKRVLKRDGRFYAVFFGRRTLAEFFESLEHVALQRGRKEVFSLRRLPTEEEAKAALRFADFHHRGVSVETREAVFPDVLALLRWLKGVGANGLGRMFLGREFLEDVGRYYAEHHAAPGGVRASFEVIWVDARK